MIDVGGVVDGRSATCVLCPAHRPFLVAPELLERAEVLCAVNAILDRTRHGRGAIAVFEGPAGSGKTALLRASAGCAREMTVSSSSPTVVERTFRFGVARALLRPLLAALPRRAQETLSGGRVAGAIRVLDDLRDEPGAVTGVSHAILEGLSGLVEQVAATRPVLLVIDDAQWADEASSSWLGYLAARVSRMPVAVLLATSPLAAGDTGALARLLSMREHVGAQRSGGKRADRALGEGRHADDADVLAHRQQPCQRARVGRSER